MNRRERTLAAGAGIVAVFFITYLAINRVFLMPAAQRFNRANELMEEIERARAEKAKEPTYRARLKELAGRAFGTDPLRVSERVRARLTDLLAKSGLDTEHLTLKPVVGARAPGIYREVGWLIQVRGRVSRVVDFLYLVTREPHLHRIDNLIITPVRGEDEVELQAKYGTLVLEPKVVRDFKTDTVDGEMTRAALSAPERRRYDVIASRAFFRPYVPAPKKESPPPPQAEPRREEPRAPPPPAGQYRVVSLSSLGGSPEVVVRETRSGTLARYKPGEEWGGGRIALVDYRPLPKPENPDILSMSRVVLRIGSEYYAVELGACLEQKYRLGPDRLPPGLPTLESDGADTAPSDAAQAPPSDADAADAAPAPQE
ncbi:MAG: hypothetical protein R6X20_14160 [Phycisphaerae bacterium]